MKINITQNGKTISVESADPNASVPDTTVNAGPDAMKLDQDAMKSPSDPEAEFNADVPATQSKTEADDKPEEAEKANEALVLAKYLGSKAGRAALKKAIQSKESEDPDSATDDPTTPADTAVSDPAPAVDDTTTTSSDVGEVTQTDDAIEIDAGNGVKITVTNDEADAAGNDTPADASECGDAAAPGAVPTEGANPNANAPAPGATPAEGADANAPADPNNQSLESFFANLNLNDL